MTHALMRPWLERSSRGVLLAALVCIAPASAFAQGRADSTRVAPPATQPQPAAVGARPSSASALLDKAPLTPKRAFLYSLALPGLGQSRLDRGTSGALFASVELTALVMLRRVNADLREAKAYRTDSLPTNFTPAGDTVRAVARAPGKYTADLIRTRRLHLEDWLAVVAFNHLFSGADAFVSAQLFDMPVQLSAVPAANGPWFVASIRF
ncbi:MAG: hypothetical protein IBJ19_08380 [Gemmatimonadaceae bacterium]|nr:hypothetical protein [Gemmatimonadaceae bacterium]